MRDFFIKEREIIKEFNLVEEEEKFSKYQIDQVMYRVDQVSEFADVDAHCFIFFYKNIFIIKVEIFSRMDEFEEDLSSEQLHLKTIYHTEKSLFVVDNELSQRLKRNLKIIKENEGCKKLIEKIKLSQKIENF